MTDNNNALYQLRMPSPPKSEVDENSLKKSMDKNKECEYRPLPYFPVAITFPSVIAVSLSLTVCTAIIQGTHSLHATTSSHDDPPTDNMFVQTIPVNSVEAH